MDVEASKIGSIIEQAGGNWLFGRRNSSSDLDRLPIPHVSGHDPRAGDGNFSGDSLPMRPVLQPLTFDLRESARLVALRIESIVWSFGESAADSDEAGLAADGSTKIIGRDDLMVER